jgi:uncharacterized protein (UPF0332 family)
MPAEWEVYLAKAEEALRVAQSAKDRGQTNSAANRAYYAAYLAEYAALQKLDPLRPSPTRRTHKTVIKAFNHRLVRNGTFDSWIIQGVTELAGLRVKADYTSQDVTAAEAKECVTMAKRIVGKIGTELR